MIRSYNKLVLAIVIISALTVASVTIGRCEVVVFDDVTTVQTPIRIKVLTKGRLFAKGGGLVDIYLDDSHLKKILTGGDGYGYLKYMPRSPGLKEIIVRSDTNRSSGLILVMGQSEQAILIDVEGAFKDTLFSASLLDDSRKAVKALSKNYQIIYVSRYVGKGLSRSWLTQEDFPNSVVLDWQGPNTFEKIAKRGVHLAAVIGSDAVISAAKNHSKHRYTFGKTKDGQMVNDWDEILKRLLPSAATDSVEKEPK